MSKGIEPGGRHSRQGKAFPFIGMKIMTFKNFGESYKGLSFQNYLGFFFSLIGFGLDLGLTVRRDRDFDSLQATPPT